MIGRDIRQALRVYRRAPVFSAIATAILAISVAIATAVFSLYSHLALQPVPAVQHADRWVSLGLASDANDWIPFSTMQFEALRERLTVPDAMVAASVLPRDVDIGDTFVNAMVAGVSRGYLDVLGVELLLGVDLDAASPDPGARNAVISEWFWREQLEARASALGSTLVIGNQEFTVVGVTGGGFGGLHRGERRDDIWIPVDAALSFVGPNMFGMTDEQRRRAMASIPFVRAAARLPAGMTIERLRQELGVVWPQVIQSSAAGTNQLLQVDALPGVAASPRTHQVLVRQSQLLVGGAVLVLVVASLNLASFFLARGPGRLAELRTRLAIGASRGAVVRQLLVESATLIGTATALGLLLHFWLRTLLLRLPPFVDVPQAQLQVGTDWRVFVFVAAAALAVTMVAGLLPAVRIAAQSRLSLTSPAVLGGRTRNMQPLLMLQVAVATLIVLASVLFIAELYRLEGTSAQFDASGLVAGRFSIEPGAGRAALHMRVQPAQMEQFMRELTERVLSVPGVEGFAVASAIPYLTPPTNPAPVELVGVDIQPPESQRRAYENRVGPEFFRLVKAGFLYGRPFDPLVPLEIVVSRTLALQLWGRADVVGERLMQGEGGTTVDTGNGVMMTAMRTPESADGGRPEYLVVGVVDDVRYSSQEAGYAPMLYRYGAGPLLGQSYLVRGTVESTVLHPVLDEVVRARFAPVRAEQPVALTTAMYQRLGSERARSRLAVTAAMIALALTMIGLYASMQHMVDARRSELALRKAIGADDHALVAMILRRAGSIVAAGAAGAVSVALVLGGPLSNLMFGLDARSAGAWLAALLVIVLTGLVAAWVPATRAGRVDPVLALRYD